MTMRTTVRGTPYTTQSQYQGSGINTASQASGVPYSSTSGNPAETRRVVSADTYGKVESGNQGNAADPASNGPGVVLNGAPSAGAMDSPVPSGAPKFDPGFMDSENRAHLGSGNESGTGPLMTSSGVMGR